MTRFARATAVEPLGDGAWRATCEGDWSTEVGPNGGYLAAVILRAMTAELDDPEREARSLTCHYLRPPAAGELRVDVTVERSGRSLSTLTARLSQHGRPCVVATAAFAIELDGAVDYAGAAPAVPGPEELERLAPVATVPMTRCFEMHPALGKPLFAGADEPVLAVFRSSTSAGGFFEEDGELWSRDGVLLAHSRQLALLLEASA